VSAKQLVRVDNDCCVVGTKGDFAASFPKNCMTFLRTGECSMAQNRVLACRVDLSVSGNNLGLFEFGLVVEFWLKMCLRGHGGGVREILDSGDGRKKIKSAPKKRRYGNT
jgi:hypothetical protein